MKRYDTALCAILGLTVGLIGGYYLGADGGTPIPSAETPKLGVVASAGAEMVSNSGPPAEQPPTDWMSRYTSQFRDVSETRPTRLADMIGEALRMEAPFDEARMLVLIDMMRKEDFPVALELLRKAKSPMNSTSMRSLGPPMWVAFWLRFGERDPATALAKALECGDLKYADRNRLEHYLFRGMARNNPRAAAEALAAHPDLPNRGRAIGGLMLEWVRTDPVAASEWARERLAGDELANAFYSATWGVANLLDIGDANSFAKSLPDGPARAQALRSIRDQIAQKPEVPAQQILDFVTALRESGKRDRNFEARMASRCGAIDPIATANFFSQSTTDAAGDDFAELKVVSAEWIRRDSQAAENWLKGKSGTPAYEIVATEFVTAAQEKNDQAEANRWMKSIEAHRSTPPPR
jgi:hypothetical protein